MRRWLEKLLWGARPKHDYDRYHYVDFTIGPAGLKVTIVCKAPEGAFCRTWCDEGCEVATLDHDLNHVKRDVGYCVRTTGWFDEDPIDLYAGDETRVRSGAPVKLNWIGDGYYTWEYYDSYLSGESK